MKRKEGKVNVGDENGGIAIGETRGRRVHQEEAPSAPMTVLHIDMKMTGATTEVTTRQGVAADEIHIPAVGGRNRCRLLLQVTVVLQHREEAAVDREMSQCTTGSQGVPGEDQDARLPRSTRVRLYDRPRLQHLLYVLQEPTTLRTHVPCDMPDASKCCWVDFNDVTTDLLNTFYSGSSPGHFTLLKVSSYLSNVMPLFFHEETCRYHA